MQTNKVTRTNIMGQATLFGAAYSVYVRIARLVMEEVGMPYDRVEIDVFSKDGLPADYAARHILSAKFRPLSMMDTGYSRRTRSRNM